MNIIEVRKKPLVPRKFLCIRNGVSRSAQNKNGIKCFFHAGEGCGCISISLPLGSELDAPTELSVLRGALSSANPNVVIEEKLYTSTSVLASLQFSFRKLPNGHVYRDQ